MPAKSKAQQTAMCMALAARKGDLEVSKLKGAALDIYNSDMTNKEIEEFTVMENNLKNHLTNNLSNISESIFMKELKNYINEQLNQNITESKKNPLLKKEIKTDEFEIGDIVLFKDFIEAGDEDDIMVVVEPLGDRCDVEHIGTLSILGSMQTLANKYLFKVGHTTVEKNGKTHFIDIEDALNQCEKIGMDVTVPRKNELYRGKFKRF